VGRDTQWILMFWYSPTIFICSYSWENVGDMLNFKNVYSNLHPNHEELFYWPSWFFSQILLCSLFRYHKTKPCVELYKTLWKKIWTIPNNFQLVCMVIYFVTRDTFVCIIMYVQYMYITCPVHVQYMSSSCLQCDDVLMIKWYNNNNSIKFKWMLYGIKLLHFI